MTTRKVRTRIAPSPTGFLHLGTARTALYSWAYARHFGGEFVLRIEDTDVARSTQDSVDQILASMHWLGLDYDEGPVYQMQRLGRYRAVVEQMLAAGTAYRCYSTPDELTAMRDAQKERGEKTHYDGRWRPEPGKLLPPIPEGVLPVVRFRNPPEGDVSWNDLVKGRITINNREIDDLIIVRPDGVPTYNFCVVVDDWDMNISHVFRGDEHVNNTPWQINIFNALGAPLPLFGHVPVILGDDGQKLSKRRGAVSVTAYEENGYLPEAMLNYLARLAGFVAAQFSRRGIEVAADELLARMCALFKDRCATTVELADWLAMYFVGVEPSAEDLAANVTEVARPAVQTLRGKLASVAWNKPAIAAAIKETLAVHSLKMPQLAPAVRVLVCGRVQTPSLDSVLELFAREKVLARLQEA